MINKRKFYTKKGKISKSGYCDKPELIENYKEAMDDKEHMWICHHKLEALYTMQELIDIGRYYHVVPRELIFIKDEKEHAAWPHKGRKEAIEKMRKTRKEHPLVGEKNSFYGKHHTEETKEKIRKRVVCIETGQVFKSVRDAGLWLGMKSGSGICDCCRGKKESVRNYHFKYL